MLSILRSAKGTEHGARFAAATAHSPVAGIDLWIVPAPRMAAIAATQSNLSEDELTHANRLRRDSDRVRYMAVRSQLRVALAHSLRNEVGNGGWQLHTNEFGKPELPSELDFLSFNITHAGAFSAIAVTTSATIGIDAEEVEAGRLKYMPFDCFSPREQSHLRGLADDRRHVDFFKLWTLKEAYAKALGLGFSAEFNRIEFGLDPISLDRKSPQAAADDRESFSLMSLEFEGATYFLAICLLNAARPARAFKQNLFVVGS